MRILIYGINYLPELTGIGKYTGEMAEWMAQNGNDVSVITAMPYYPEWKIHKNYRKKLWYKEIVNDVKVYRCPFYVPQEASSKKRIIHELSFLYSSSFHWLATIFKKKYDLIITIAPPFHIGIHSYLYSKIKKAILVNHIQDLQIDAAKDLNMLSSPKALNLMLKLERFLLRRSNFVSTLTDGMKGRILRKGIRKDKILMLPNWVDTSFIRPMERKYSLRDAFGIPLNDKVFLYSGNMGKKQGLELLIDVAEHYKNRADIHFIMVGSGAEKANLEKMANDKRLVNMKFFPLQPYASLPALLATADVHLVLQRKEASDLVMPSKLTGILSAGGCAIVTAIADSSLYEDIKKYNIGVLCEPESKQALQNAIDLVLFEDMSQIKKNARSYAEAYLNKDKILSQFLRKVQGINDINI